MIVFTYSYFSAVNRQEKKGLKMASTKAYVSQIEMKDLDLKKKFIIFLIKCPWPQNLHNFNASFSQV